MIRRRVVVRGTVQGVFFRSSTQREAQRRHVSGWVTNRADGAVEAVFEGQPADVEALITWAAGGPPQALVTGIDVTEEEPRGEHHFRVVSDRG
jgi:acylphosphatase